MNILDNLFNIFRHQGAAMQAMQNESDVNDEFASKGFDTLLGILEEQVDKLEIIKNNQNPHYFYWYPVEHPFHDTWD